MSKLFIHEEADGTKIHVEVFGNRVSIYAHDDADYIISYLTFNKALELAKFLIKEVDND